MKRIVKIWWPYQAQAEEVIEVEIPDGVDQDKEYAGAKFEEKANP